VAAPRVDHALPSSCVPGIGWPGLATSAGASILALHWQLERSQWWPHERLLEHQFRQVRALAAHAIAHSPYYRSHLEQSGLEGVSALTPQTFLRWPVLKKSEVQPNFARLRAAQYPKEHGASFETSTSGSTGEPTCVVHSEIVRFLAHALALRDHLWQERDFSAKFAAIRVKMERAVSRGWGAAFDAAFATGPLATLSSSTDVDEQLDWLVEQRPAYLFTYPSNLHALVLRSRETGKVPLGLRQAICFGETLPEGLAELVGQTWHAGFADTYSCMEFGVIALQCPRHGGYHVQSESVYVETLRDDGSPCLPGETGRVVVSSLHNFPMPLLRYELGDYAEVGATCPCGRGLPVLRRIAGRTRNMARDPAGRRFWPAIQAGAWLRIAPLRKIQLVQRSIGEVEVRFVMERDLSAEETTALRAQVQERLEYPFDVSFARVTEIPRTPGGKFEDFISELPPD
jgi:phenylacetate-CoA ligase